MSTKIGSRGKREALEARREPYWARVREGCYVGYRKIEEGAGTWVARYRDDAGKQKYRALGTFVDGKTNAYDQAVKAAEKLGLAGRELEGNGRERKE
jgi:hypothetical protein